MTAATHPTRRRWTARALARCLALAGFLPALVHAAPQRPEGPPLILGATIDPAAMTVTVRGRHFGSAPPTVRLSGVALRAIANDDRTVLARLASGKTQGRVVVEVTRADGGSASRAVTLRPSRATAPRAAGSPVIEDASATGLVSIRVRGRNLGDRAPTLALDGLPLRLLTFDGSTVTARVGPDVAPGTHVLTVTTAAGAAVSTKVTLRR